MAISATLRLDTTQYDQGIARARTGIKGLEKEMESAGHSSVSSMQAASGAIRLLENPLSGNVRAIERLISSSKLLSSALTMAFPAVAGASLLIMLGKLSKEVYDFSEKAKNAGNTIKDAFRTLNDQAETANATLQVSNDKLDEQIAKLSGGHKNTIKTELDESREAADKLADSLQADADKLDKLMSANGVSTLSGLAAMLTSGKFTSPTKDLDNMTSQFGSDNRTNAGAIHDATLGGGDGKAQIEAAKKTLLKQREQLQTYLLQQEKMQSQDPLTNYSSTIEGARGAIRNNIDEYNHVGLTQDNDSKKGQVAGLEQSNADAAAAAKALAEREAFRQKMVSAYDKEQEDERSHIEEMAHIGDEMAAKLAEADDKALAERKRAAAELEKSQDEIAQIVLKGKDALQEQAIGFGVATGSISAHLAALQMETLHTREYTQALAELKAQQDAANNSGDNSESLNINKKIAELNANRGVQQGQDAQNVNSTSMLGELQQLFKVDLPQELMQTFKSFIDQFNEALLSKHPGKGIKQAAANGLHSMAKSGLKSAEGSLLGAFGIKSGPLGSRSNPIYTKSADGVGKLTGGSGGGGIKGIFGKILGGILPGFASGGDIGANQVSIIGENGPEIFSPKSSGTITPNNKLRFGGAMGSNPVYNIDARHSSSPSETARMVLVGMRASHEASVKSSAQLQHEKNRRTPASARR
jgi:hypothetical protein